MPHQSLVASDTLRRLNHAFWLTVRILVILSLITQVVTGNVPVAAASPASSPGNPERMHEVASVPGSRAFLPAVATPPARTTPGATPALGAATATPVFRPSGAHGVERHILSA